METSLEFLDRFENERPILRSYVEESAEGFYNSAQGACTICDVMVEFARMHVLAALKQAAEKATVYADEGGYSEFVDEESILNAYSINNIK